MADPVHLTTHTRTHPHTPHSAHFTRDARMASTPTLAKATLLFLLFGQYFLSASM